MIFPSYFTVHGIIITIIFLGGDIYIYDIYENGGLMIIIIIKTMMFCTGIEYKYIIIIFHAKVLFFFL